MISSVKSPGAPTEVASVSSVVAPGSAPHASVLQRRLDFPDLKTGRPFMSINAVMGWLDKDEDTIKYLYEDGLLRFAFNIASPRAQKAEVRILTECVRAYIRMDHLNLLSVPRAQDDLDAVLKTIFPHSRATVRGTEIRRALNCSSQHILDLDSEGCLKRDEKVKLRTPKSSPSYHRSSVINFLKSRRLP